MSATDLEHCRSLLQFAAVHRAGVEAVAKATGCDFNIFKILRIRHHEVKTHSPILSELLDPKGQHGQGAMFLRLFLTRFDIRGFDSNSARVEPEYRIGPVIGDFGGRIDILLRDRNYSTIIIENKIYAPDGLNQLVRYRQAFPRAELFYLTLYGRAPDGVPAAIIASLKCISYKTDILDWLRDCHQAAVGLPVVRETIVQYVVLIEELTGQRSNSMHEDLVEEITGSKNNLAAFFTLQSGPGPVYSKLMSGARENIEKLGEKYRSELEWELSETSKDGNSSCYFWFKTPDLTDRNLRIGFGFDEPGFRDFAYGLAKIDHKEDRPVDRNLVVQEFQKEFGLAPPVSMDGRPGFAYRTDTWPAFAYWEHPYGRWQAEAWEGVRSGEFVKLVEEKLIKLIKVAEKVCAAFPPAAASREESCDSPAPGDLQIAPGPQSNNAEGQVHPSFDP